MVEVHGFARRAVALLAGAAVWLALGVAPAGAKVVVDQLTHKRFGIVAVPTLGAPHYRSGGCNAVNNDCTPLSYGGGPVIQVEHVHLFFWTPSGHAVPSTYKSGLATWVKDVASKDYTPGNPFSVNQQYYSKSGSTKSFVHYAVSYYGSSTDTTAYPKSDCVDTDATGAKIPICLTDAQLASELSSYATAHSLPMGFGNVYFIMTPQNVGSCFDSTSSSCSYEYPTGYCGYHSWTVVGPSDLFYADMPWAYNTKYCDVNLAFSAGYAHGDDLDSTVSTFSHELSESMTDPTANSWIQQGGTDAGYEIGDKCAYIYGAGGFESLSGLSNNGLGYWNVAFGSDKYLIQLEFSNRNKTCMFSDTDTQPKVTLSVTPSSPKAGSAATFKANVTDPAGVNKVLWYFGDGSNTTGTSVKHTYTTAGPVKVTAYVTDGHGNQVRVTKNVTVS